ncbi:MAG: ligand-binding sensor domain-containing protein [Crocinitomicaceae bacterium]|jgi:ligand-binding sensor domain-containing protein
MTRITILLFCLISLSSIGQEPYYQNLKSSHGLASNNVYYCFQDHQGYMWLGTDLVVSRFDGYSFEKFDHEDGLLGNEIFQIYQDSKERIWFLSLNGELGYYKDGSFHNSRNTSWLANYHSESFISSIIETANGDLFIASNDSTISKLNSDNKFTTFVAGTKNYKFWIDHGALHLLTFEGIRQYKNGGFELDEKTRFNKAFPLALFYKDALYIGYTNNILLYSGGTKEVLNLPEGADITWVGPTKHEDLLVGTRDGLYFYDVKTRQISVDKSMDGSIITSSFYDQEGNLWISSLGNGIFFSPQPEILIYDNDSQIPVKQITTIERGLDNSLWI